MNHRFDELAKAASHPTARRAALKTFGIGLAAIAITLMTFTPAFGRGTTTFRYTVKLLAVGDEPHASGTVKVTVIHLPTYGTYSDSVSCKGLTPGDSYQLVGSGWSPWLGFSSGIQVATTQGAVQFEHGGAYGDMGYPNQFDIYRIQPGGDVLVLSGVLR